MDSHQLPKTLNLFLEDIYKEFPYVKTHPDYNFYYLFVDDPIISEYLFCVVDDFLYNSFLAEQVNESMTSKAVFYNFEQASILNHYDFTQLEKLLQEKFNELKKTEKTILFYQVW
jgi:hypothetical protein